MNERFERGWLIAVSLLLTSCAGESGTPVSLSGDAMDLRGSYLANPLAYISAQCFTKTEDVAGKVHNPCYACHVDSQEPNYVSDGDIQRSFAFPGVDEVVLKNPWENLFKDRRAAVAEISDDLALTYVRMDNYRGGKQLPLRDTLSQALPPGWDVNGNQRWDGYLPDAWFDFDGEGFDRTPEGALTGWRAFAYTPFLGTFWPTNGSTDDVLIRLPASLRNGADGRYDPVTYKTNLAIVTAMVQRRDVALEVAVDENRFQVDLDKDGKLATAKLIRYDWAPLQGRTMSYVGQGKAEQAAGRLHLAAGLFPEGTEFLHSVRYLDVDAQGQVGMAARMKELRYARKATWYTYSDLKEMALKEVKENITFPDRTRQFTGNAESGLGNGQGWVYQGFIEDRLGALRPQSYEETVYCMGCHSGIGATTDGVFAFPRKLGDGSYRNGWYHWSQQGLVGIPEPRRGDGAYEYTHYLSQNGAGDEFRSNDEVLSRFFQADGRLKADKVERLHQNIAELLLPSRERALQLDKAYRLIVSEQSFVAGRDATVAPAVNVHREIAVGTPTGIVAPVNGP